MRTDGFNKSINNQLTTSELTAGLSLKVCQLFIYFPRETE